MKRPPWIVLLTASLIGCSVLLYKYNSFPGTLRPIYATPELKKHKMNNLTLLHLSTKNYTTSTTPPTSAMILSSTSPSIVHSPPITHIKPKVEPKAVPPPHLEEIQGNVIKDESPHWEGNDITIVSQNEDLDVRSKWQMEQMDKFCTKYNLDSQQNTLPNGAQGNILNRHLIFSREKQFLFCFLPKTGCTTLRRLILVMQGLLPIETAKQLKLPESKLRKPMEKSSYMNKQLTTAEKLRQIKTYFKFVMIRNPLERLVSAYRDKIAKPLSFTQRDRGKNLVIKNIYWDPENFFEVHKRYILSKYYPNLLRDWAKAEGSYELVVNFTTYIRRILDTDDWRLNEHFSSIIFNAAPCRIRYHLYFNFKNYSREVRLLVKKLNTSLDYFTDHNTHERPEEQTEYRLSHYYSMLSDDIKKKLLIRMSKDLDFYYHLYPEDRWSHLELLGINQPIYNGTFS